MGADIPMAARGTMGDEDRLKARLFSHGNTPILTTLPFYESRRKILPISRRVLRTKRAPTKIHVLNESTRKKRWRSQGINVFVYLDDLLV